MTGAGTTQVTRPEAFATILAVDTPEQVELLTGRELSAAQRGRLHDGGLLLWSDTQVPPRDEQARTELVVRAGDTVIGRTAPVPVSLIDVATCGWRTGTDGIMLTSRARQLRLPVSDGFLLYTGVTPARAAAVQQALTAAGLDARTVQVYAPPPPVIPQPALVATALGLIALVLAGCVAATRSQTRALKGYLAQLISLGIPPAWARHVLLYQQAVTLTTAIYLAAAAGSYSRPCEVTKIDTCCSSHNSINVTHSPTRRDPREDSHNTSTPAPNRPASRSAGNRAKPSRFLRAYRDADADPASR